MASDFTQRRGEGSSSSTSRLKVILPEKVTAKSREECRRSLVVKIISGKNIGYNTLLGTLKAIWTCKKDFAIIGLRMNLFQIQFELEQDADRVLMGCPWYQDSQLMIVKKWRPGIENDERAFNFAPIWVQVWGLPLEWVSEDAGEEICGRLGLVLKKQVVFGGNKYGKFVRCLVEMDVSQPLVQGMIVGQGDAEEWVNFKYEHVSYFCAYCGIIGHLSSSCDARVADQREGIYREEVFGPELHGVPIKSLVASPSVLGNSQRRSVQSSSPSVRGNDLERQLEQVESLADHTARPSSSADPSPVEQPVLPDVLKDVKGKGKVVVEGESSMQNEEHEAMLVEEKNSIPMEVLMLEWYQVEAEQRIVPYLSSITIEEIIDDTTGEDEPEMVAEQQERTKKRKFQTGDAPIIMFPNDADVEAKHFVIHNQEVGDEADISALSEPFLKKLKIMGSEISETDNAGVEAAGPKRLPPSQ